VALKTIIGDLYSSEDKSSHEEGESMNIIVHGLKKIFISKELQPQKAL